MRKSRKKEETPVSSLHTSHVHILMGILNFRCSMRVHIWLSDLSVLRRSSTFGAYPCQLVSTWVWQVERSGLHLPCKSRPMTFYYCTITMAVLKTIKKRYLRSCPFEANNVSDKWVKYYKISKKLV